MEDAEEKKEENEEVMFCHRAKLYRFLAEDKQWKERGVGDIKLLRNNLTGKMRVLMRREQVLKLCANHHITTDMKLMPNAGSERSWVWSTAADFSEEGCKAERLAVRFKNEHIAKQFKEKFEECQEILKTQALLKLPIQEKAAQEEKGDQIYWPSLKLLGSWECDACLVRNDSDKVECAACGSLKGGVEATQVPSSTGRLLFGSGLPTSGAGFTFGSAAPSAGEVSWECDACLVRNDSDKVECAAGGSLKGGVEATQVPSSTGRPLFGSGLPTSGAGFTFGSAAPSAGEVSWECDACLVRNDSDKVECAACGTPKPGVEISEEKRKTYGNAVFGSSTTPSGTKFSFGAATPSSGSGITFGSGGAGFTFGSAGSSDGGTKPPFTFGSLNQTPSFGPLNQEGKATEDQTQGKEKDEGSESDKQTDDSEEVEQPVTEEEACGPSDEAPAGDGNKEDKEQNR